MAPIQQMLIGVGASKKTYVDDLFSTYVYTGDGSARSINNGVDLSGEGGLVWTKIRNQSYGHFLFNTVNGNGNYLRSDTSDTQATYATSGTNAGITAFNNNGYSLGADQSFQCLNYGSNDYSSWTFRKAKGFFDIVEYQGTGSAKTVAHSLGSVPGLILIKATDSSENWRVYHKSLTGTHHLVLNLTNQVNTGAAHFNDTNPTASVFSVGTDDAVNQDGKNFIAYVFAGGESTAATARSVDFDGDDNLKTAGDNSFKFGTGDWTIEGWYKWDSLTSPDGIQYLFDQRNTDNGHYAALFKQADNTLRVYIDSDARITSATTVRTGQWYHICLVRSSGVIKLYINGLQEGSAYSNSSDFDGDRIFISYSERVGTNYSFNGFISNFRVTKSAVYTAAFRLPTKPLTNITNTVLLCCNNASVTGSTVTTGALSSSGDPTASTDSPFDDPAGFKFGENGDQNVIKCGSYKGSSSSTVDVELGFEPQWVLIKNSTGTSDWYIGDALRGTVTGEHDARLYANDYNAEVTNEDHIDFTPTGFKAKNNDGSTNDDHTHVYVAIRRPDGYVGKPAEAGTDVFAMDTGADSSTIPNFDSGFPVDMGIYRRPATAQDWYLATRLLQGKENIVNTDAATSNYNKAVFDSNLGWQNESTHGSSYQSWMWKRHAGFDVVTYTGNDTARWLPHNLNGVPEMIWVKRRSSTGNWWVYHVGANGGSNPEGKELVLNTTAAEVGTNFWAVPTSTHFYIGGSSHVNDTGTTHLVMLFRSVAGISKIGYYTGNGSATGPSISVGFQPRFIIIKAASQSGPWRVLDTLRDTLGSGTDKELSLNTNAAQGDHTDWLDITSTGFDIKTSDGEANASSGKYIYYAHA